MHQLEPYYNWREYYTAEDDVFSPFYGREYSEFMYSDTIYNHYIHPQWDNFGSPTLVMKILMANYDVGYAVIELLGEWNDCINNDIMFLKREVADALMNQGINKFILITENVLNFHASDDCYYEEWFEDVNETDGWIAMLNARDHVLKELSDANIDSYFLVGGQLEELAWRTDTPATLFEKIEMFVTRRLDFNPISASTF